MEDLNTNPQSALDFDKEVFLSKSNLKSIHNKQKRQCELFEDSDDDLLSTSKKAIGEKNADDLELFWGDLIDGNVTAESICAVSMVTPIKESDNALDGRTSGCTRSHSTQEISPYASENSCWGRLISSTRRIRKVAKEKTGCTEDVDLDLFGDDLTDDNITAQSIFAASTVTHDKESDHGLDRSHLKRKASSSTQGEKVDPISARTRSHSTQGEILNASARSGWGQFNSGTRPVRNAAVASRPYFRVPPQKVSKYIPSTSMVRTEGTIEVIKKSSDQFLLRYIFKDRLKILEHHSTMCEV